MIASSIANRNAYAISLRISGMTAINESSSKSRSTCAPAYRGTASSELLEVVHEESVASAGLLAVGTPFL
jgi:hypothetical protein